MPEKKKAEKEKKKRVEKREEPKSARPPLNREQLEDLRHKLQKKYH